MMAAIIIGAIIAGVSTLLGVIISGIINYFQNKSQFERETKRLQQQLIRDKLEELCKTAEKIGDWYRATLAESYFFLSTNRKLEGEINKLPIDRLTMLISFYAVPLKPFLELIIEHNSLFNDTIHIILNIAETSEIRVKALADLQIEVVSIEKICEAIISASADLARKYI
jgi:hypothetical protein